MNHMDQLPTDQQPAGQPPSGVPPQAGWGTLFRMAWRVWAVPAIWIAGFFLQVYLIRNTGLKDIPNVWRYFEIVLLIEAALLFSLSKRLLTKGQ